MDDSREDAASPTDEAFGIPGPESTPFATAWIAEPGLRLDVSSVEVDGLVACHVAAHHGGAFRFVDANDAWHLVIVRAGHLRLQLRSGDGRAVEVGTAVLVDGATVSGGSLTPNTAFDCLSFPVRILHEHLSRSLDSPVRSRIQFTSGLEDNADLVTILFQLGGALRISLHQKGAATGMAVAAREVRGAMLAVLLHAAEHNHSNRLFGHSRPGLSPGHAKRAVDFMRANASRNIAMTDVARAAGASLRTLQVAFRRFYGCSPSEYLRTLRLQGARGDLLDASDSSSVAAVAARWGFGHLGMFSANYRRAFGELPSRTRARKA